MSCGSPLGDLFYMADRLLDGARSGAGPSVQAAWSPTPLAALAAGTSSRARQPGADDLRAQLYQMYGEGEIGEAVFSALRPLADQGRLRPADLAVHRARVRRRPGDGDDAATANALRGVRSRLAQLSEARTGSERVVADLAARLAGLDARMTGKEQAARDALASGRDEQTARARLAEKAELASSRDRLAAEVQALQASLAQLDDVRLQLEAKATELEAVRARQRLAQEVLK